MQNATINYCFEKLECVNEPSSTLDTFLLCIMNFSSSTPISGMFLSLKKRKKKVLELTVLVNRQLSVLATCKPGCAINRKDKKVKQEELCWSQVWAELRKAGICLLFTSMLQWIRPGKGRGSPGLCVYISLFCSTLCACGLVFDYVTVNVLELQPVQWVISVVFCSLVCP